MNDEAIELLERIKRHTEELKRDLTQLVALLEAQKSPPPIELVVGETVKISEDVK